MFASEQVQQYLREMESWGQAVKQAMEAFSLEEEPFRSMRTEIEALLSKTEGALGEGEISRETVSEIQEIAGRIYGEILALTLEDRIELERETQVPIGRHTLPPLPYRYDALEPHISAEIMKLHHDTHHKSYVDGLNMAETMMQRARETNNFDLLKHWEREAAFHGSGHYLHTIFWSVMSPDGGGSPTGALAVQIKRDFGSFEKFKRHFSEAANKAEGVGWAILVWAPRARRLEILQSEKHQLMTQWDTIPILVLDVWEHAYYLQYKANRADYVKNWWNVVNWNEAEKRFREASRLKWEPF